MRVLTADPNRQAQEAVELFVWRAVREFGALAASLGGVDGIVFTDGIGENHAEIRRRICERLGWLGLRSDEHTSELQSLMRISYAVLCLKKKRNKHYACTYVVEILFITY